MTEPGSPLAVLPMADTSPAPLPIAPAAPEPAPAPPAASEEIDLDAIAAQLDEVQQQMPELDPMPRKLIKDHVAAINELHRAALRTIVRTLRADERGKELLFELVEDPAVHMVLAMHGIVRTTDPMAIANKALDDIRPGIASHGGDVQLSHIEDGVAYVRLSGACNGCSMASVTMRNGVEKALMEALPSITSVEVLPDEAPKEEAPLLQLSVVGADGATESAPAAPAETGWFKTFPIERIPPGTLEALSLRPDQGESVEVIVVNAGGKMAAYINACAHQGMPLDKAMVDAEEGTLTCPWHGFCFDATNGECLTAPGAQLEQLPLRLDDGHVWVRAGG